MTSQLEQYVSTPDSLNRHPAMKWANQDVKIINGRSFKEISDQIEQKLATERNQWKPFLDRTALYVTTAATVVFLVGMLAQAGLIWAGVLTAKIIATDILFYGTTISLSVRGLFKMRHSSNQIDTRTKICIEALKEWPTEVNAVSDWHKSGKNNISELSQLRTKAQELQKDDVVSQIDSVVANIVNKNLSFLHALPECTRHLITL